MKREGTKYGTVEPAKGVQPGWTDGNGSRGRSTWEGLTDWTLDQVVLRPALLRRHDPLLDEVEKDRVPEPLGRLHVQS